MKIKVTVGEVVIEATTDRASGYYAEDLTVTVRAAVMAYKEMYPESSDA